MTARVADALPQTCYPSVWLWPGQALYAGPGLDLDPHSGSVWCLAVGVDGPLTVTADGVRIVARSVLIPPRLTHHLGSRGGRLVSCYLDPTSDRASSCRARFRDSRGDLAAGHLDEAELAAVPVDDESAGHWLAVAAPATPHLIDPRIALAAKLIREDPAASASSRQLAEHVGLSESRFLHLFRHEVGTSLRRYRLWVRLMHAGSSISAGQNLTTAAADAGFASPSHLADKFKSTFGLTASQLLATGLRVNAPGIAQEG